MSRVLLVEGTSGVGKSTLIDQLIRRYVADQPPRKLRTLLHMTQAHTYGPLAPAEDAGTLTAGRALAQQVFDTATVAAIMKGAPDTPLEPAEHAMMAFVEKVAVAADRISAADVDLLRSHGYQDEEIFDIAAAAAARCFFSKLLDALGVQPDSAFNELEPGLREALTVGRPVANPQG